MSAAPAAAPATTHAERFSLAGRIALVTGASRGLGRAIAVGLAEAGADVVCASTQRAGTDETAAAVRALGRRAWQLEADLSDHAAVLAHTTSAPASARPTAIARPNPRLAPVTSARRPASEKRAACVPAGAEAGAALIGPAPARRG